LVESLRHVILEKRELPNGYAFRIDASRLASGQLVKWIELEKRCCSFFDFEIRWDQQDGPVSLHLDGSEGKNKELHFGRIWV
jgi:hypothetical protein